MLSLLHVPLLLLLLLATPTAVASADLILMPISMFRTRFNSHVIGNASNLHAMRSIELYRNVSALELAMLRDASAEIAATNKTRYNSTILLLEDYNFWGFEIILEMFDVSHRAIDMKVMLISRQEINNIGILKQYQHYLNGRNAFVYTAYRQNNQSLFNFIKAYRPKIALMLSDETGAGIIYNWVTRVVPLFMREHCYGYSPNNTRDNPKRFRDIYIPMYKSTYFEGQSSVVMDSPVEYEELLHRNRSLVWSFIGQWNKQDGNTMIQTFKPLGKHFIHNGVANNVVREYYRDSIFVPSRRGWVTLMVSRLFEAISVGAVSVSVQSNSDLYDDLGCLEDPPWMFANTWPEAFNRSRDLLERPAELLATRRRLLEWWRDTIASIRGNITSALLS